MKYLGTSASHLWRVIEWSSETPVHSIAVEKALAKYCCYDKRKKRLNFSEIWEFLA